LAPATTEVVYRYVVAIFRDAVEDRLIPVSPCRGLKLPKIERRRVEPLATEQVPALADAMPERYWALVLAGAGTGLRQGEMFGLTPPHVDFLRRSLSVEQQLVLLPKGEPYLAPPKTEASRRTVPVPEVVLAALPATPRAVPGRRGWARVHQRPGRGQPAQPVHRVWRTAADAAELPTSVTSHDLRHLYASLLIRHGESVKVV
jgi:integrase